ncbi:MAG: hypothetical protein GXO49_04775 [Chlorobi bacterium]|nr:hypothetical protein [Chlorobiota bacterium]
MTLYIIILILGTIGVAIVTFTEKLSKNPIIKFGSYIVYFALIEFILYQITDGIEIPLLILGVFVGIALLILLVKGSFILTSSNVTIKYIVSFFFLGLAIFAGYKLYDSIMNPIRFNAEKHVRYKAAIDELKRIRTAQKAYKREFDKYTPDLDSLRHFIETGEMTVIKRIGEVPDSIYLQNNNDLAKAEKYCLKIKLDGFVRDTNRVAIKDTLFKDYDINKFGIVPFTDGLRFDMDTAYVTAGGGELKINVFEAKVSNLDLLKGLDRQLILNLNDYAIKNNRYPGLKVGDLEENNNGEGNWDKEYDILDKK